MALRDDDPIDTRELARIIREQAGGIYSALEQLKITPIVLADIPAMRNEVLCQLANAFPSPAVLKFSWVDEVEQARLKFETVLQTDAVMMTQLAAELNVIAQRNQPVKRDVAVVLLDEEQSAKKVELISGITAAVIARILNDPEELHRLSPENFEELIRDRLSAMGYDTALAGKTSTPDGGCDIIFSSRKGLSMIGAVQVKHHRAAATKTGSDAIQRMLGLLNVQKKNFNMGMVVTNTSYTDDAQWMVKDLGVYLRLRDGHDVLRWVKGEFDTEEEHREMPEKIQLTRHLVVEVGSREKRK